MPAKGIKTAGNIGYFAGLIENKRIIDLVTFASFYLVIRFGYDEWYVRFASDLALLVFLFWHSLAFNWRFWGAIAAVSTTALVLSWETADNHKYLFVYWMWVMTLAHWVQDEDLKDKILRYNARFFLVFIFLAAALQKFLSPSYMDGSMFEILLLSDGRFEAFARLAGIEHETIQEVLQRIKLLRSPAIGLASNELHLPSNDYIRWVAQLITWYDLYIQLAIGTLFLFARRGTDFAGHLLLLFFIFTTYLPAPVFGFGWTLSIMGLCITKDRFRFLHLVYFISFIAILLFHLPWREWVLTV